MGNEWKEANLTDLYEISSGLSKSADSFGSGYPFLSFKDVFYNVFAPENLSQLVQTTAKEQEGCSIKRGDVFLTRTSETMHELGMSCVALKDYESATFNGFTKRLRPRSINELVPEYVGYYLRSPKFRAGMLAFSTMSTRASLNNEMIGKLKIQFPGVEVQRSIAGILKSLDNKITLNRQLNQTLEHMAQALFKSWFVDFDPVIDNALAAGNPIPDDLQDRAERRQLQLAKADHKPLPENICKLFPSEFELTESLGWVPLGWPEVTVEAVLKRLKATKRYKKHDVEPYGKIPVYEQGQGILMGYHNGVAEYDATIDEPMFIFGDHTCVTRIGVEPFSISENVIPLCGELRNTFWTFYAVKDLQEFEEYRRHWMEWVVRPITLPSSEMADQFATFVKPFHSKMLMLEREQRRLSNLRDTLLPKLISGELRIPEAESALTLALSQRERGLESASE